MKKRILVILLSAAVVFGALPETSFGENVTADKENSPRGRSAENTEYLEPEENMGYIQPRVLTLDAQDIVESDSVVDSTGIRAASEWDQYASNYYYNLMSEEEREFYDGLDNMAYTYLTAGTNAPYEYFMDGVNFGTLSRSDAGKVWSLFRISNPQYFFLLPAYGFANNGSNILYMGIYPDFSRGGKRHGAAITFREQISAMLNEILAEPDIVAREQMIHDLIVQRVVYDPKYEQLNKDDFWHYEMYEGGFTQSAFSVFVKESKTTVCAGYSLAFELLCNAAGIENISITSTGHQWSRVRLNGSWYNVDCTWDDYDGAYGYEFIYNYFNRSTEVINGFSYSSAIHHTQESIYDKYMSSSICTLDSEATYDSIGTIEDAQGAADEPTMTSISTGSEVKITLSSPAADAKIYYTTDGTTPSVSATKSRYYHTPFTIKKNTTIKAIAVSDAYADSTVVTNDISGCTVKFDSQGGSSIAAKYILSNSTVEKPANPTRTGYTFGGWYTGTAGTNAWNFSSKITAGMTLYAKWTINTYTITYHLNNGKNISKNPAAYKVTSATIKLQDPTRSGYVFKGWYKDSKFNTKVTQIKTGSTGDLKLYAKWEKVTAPKKATLSKLTNKSGQKLAVTIKKLSGVQGYQIRYATQSNMKNARTILADTNTKTLTKLSKKKTYYVQVRAYKSDSKGKKYYGNWSNKKTIMITK